jgi:hypothetical protein
MYMTTFGGGLFKSVDRGLSWRRHGDRNPRLDHGNTLAISPAFDRDHTMFVGNFEGIWRSTDEGATFSLTTSHEIYDQAREPWRYTAKWIRPDRKGAFGGTVDFARARGAAATMPFVGREIRVRGSRGPDHGKAEIWIDGRAVTVIDCYAENAVDSTVIFESEVPWGYHVMSVRVTGEKSAASKDCTIGVDAAEVGCVGPDGPVPVFSTQ